MFKNKRFLDTLEFVLSVTSASLASVLAALLVLKVLNQRLHIHLINIKSTNECIQEVVK